jgi:hypothetical protein
VDEIYGIRMMLQGIMGVKAPNEEMTEGCTNVYFTSTWKESIAYYFLDDGIVLNCGSAFPAF